MVKIGQIVKLYTFSAGATIIAAEHNANFDTIYNEFNGNIENANIKSTAAIVDTKLAQITTFGKVHGSSISNLGSLSTAAGTIPDANLVVAGAWTASFSASNTGTITIASAYSSGYYQKIGKAVSFSGYFVVGQVTSGSGGDLRLNGLPYVNGASTNQYTSARVYADNVSSSNTQIVPILFPNFRYLILRTLVAGGATGYAASVKSASVIAVGGTYFTN